MSRIPLSADHNDHALRLPAGRTAIGLVRDQSEINR